MRPATQKLMKSLAAKRARALGPAAIIGIPAGRGSKLRKNLARNIRTSRKVMGAKRARDYYAA